MIRPKGTLMRSTNEVTAHGAAVGVDADELEPGTVLRCVVSGPATSTALRVVEPDGVHDVHLHLTEAGEYAVEWLHDDVVVASGSFDWAPEPEPESAEEA